MAHIEFLSVIMCDEVRRELVGSAVIVGATVVGTPIEIDGRRQVDRLGFYMEAYVSSVDNVKIRLKSIAHGDVVFETSFSVSRDQESEDWAESEEIEGTYANLIMATNQNSLVFPGPGAYKLQFSVDDKDDWRDIRAYPFPEARRVEVSE